MRTTITFLLMYLLANGLMAQVDPNMLNQQRQQLLQQYQQQKAQARQQYDNRRHKAEEEYAAFRKRANEAYAEAMRQAWEQMTLQPAEPKPIEPPAPKPPIPIPDHIPTTIPLPMAETIPMPVQPTPQPLPPIPEPEPETPTLQFELYNTTCNVHADVENLSFQLTGIDEKHIAEAWQHLSQEKYNGLLHDCLAQRDALHLADWGYLRLLGNISEKLVGKGSNEAVLLQMYLFAQSGYRVRIGRQKEHLVLLVPFNRPIYNYSFVRIDGIKHFVLSEKEGDNISICSASLPREQISNIMLTELPTLGGEQEPMRTFSGKKFGTMRASVGVDGNLITFMNDYPLSDAWEYYALAGLSETVKNSLYPTLRSQIEGKSKQKAAYMLLDFVQHAFDYATDQEQFGYERPLFGDESFYYPKNDCEDRSILYSILVRDLLGLDVVLVNWPGHLGTAVAFSEEVAGDYFTIEGKRYTVCDPTYIGAGIGETMPNFKGVEAKIVKL